MDTKKNQGFTLLELLISVGLLSIMGIMTAQTMKNTNRRTKKITRGIDEINSLRSAFRLIEKDIASAFNYRDINIFLYNQAQKERVTRYDQKKKDYVDKKNKEGANPPLNLSSLTQEQLTEMEKEIGKKPVEKPLQEEIVITHFKGEKDSFYFTSSAATRLRETEKISELMEVGYFIKECRSLRDLKKRSPCLWRSVSYNLDGDIKEGGTPSVLIENIEEFKIEYLTFNTEDPEWIEEWDSENTADAITGNKFPSAVYLKLVINVPLDKKGKKTKKETLVGTFPVRFPNNDPFENLISNNTPNNTNPAPTPGGTN